jgi:hypothetical protein
MALITYYKSATVDGGAIGTQLTDGGIDDLLPAVTSQDRLNGLTFHRKIWIQSDTALNILNSLANHGQYGAVWFETANINDTVANILGTERKYGAAKIVSNTTISAIVENNANYTIFAANDYFYIGTDVVQITTVTDNLDGTSTISFSPAIPTADHTGTYASSLINKPFTVNTPVPFWVKIDIPALAPLSASYNTLQFLTVY